jgi:UDP-glucuronate decarboxylase
MRCVVTGGAGFVGSHLVDALITAGHEVIVIDNLHTGSWHNVSDLEDYCNFTFIEGDVKDDIDIPGQVDRIYHLACPASPPHYQEDMVKTLLTSTHGTYNMLKLAKEKNARLLFTSTSEIYGDPLVHPQPESYWGNVNTLGPRSCYDEGKRCAEAYCYSFANQHNLQVRIARIFNTFGPRMNPEDGRVVSNFILAALRGEPLKIYGDGTQTRSFMYVDDLVRGLVLLMESDESMNCVPVNLGNPVEYTIRSWAETVINEVNKFKGVNENTGIECIEASVDDPKQRKPDITRAFEKLGWKPEVDVLDGVRKTIKYFSTCLEVD